MTTAQIGILGKKIGMTRFFKPDGTNIPVTVIQAGPCYVTQVKTTETDGYPAVQISFDEMKPRNSTQAMIGHDAKAGAAPQRMHREIRLESDAEAQAYTLGQEITLEALSALKFVDVIGTSKGKDVASIRQNLPRGRFGQSIDQAQQRGLSGP